MGSGKAKLPRIKMRINYRITYMSSLYNLLLPLPKKFKPLGDLFVVNLSQWILRNSEFSLNGTRHRMQPMPTFKKVERAQVIIQDGQELHLKKCAKCRAEGAEQWRIFSCSELRHVHPQIAEVSPGSSCKTIAAEKPQVSIRIGPCSRPKTSAGNISRGRRTSSAVYSILIT
jgi:hypothetical protein